MMSAAIETAPEFAVQRPQTVFDLEPYRTVPAPEHYAFDPDRERFLVVKRGRRARASERLVVVRNWLEEVRRLAPAD